MFVVELISGGAFMVYAVNAPDDTFLIYKDSEWCWMPITETRPHYTGPYTAAI